MPPAPDAAATAPTAPTAGPAPAPAAAVPRTQAQRTAAAKEAIVAATLQVLADHGVQGVTTAEVAQAAGVSKGLVHYHFESKEGLLLAAQTAFFRGIFESITAMAAELEPGWDRAMWALDELWGQILAARDTVPVMVQLASQATGEGRFRRRFLIFGHQHELLLAEGIRLVLGPEEARLKVDIPTATRIVMAGLVGFASELLFSDDPTGVDTAFAAWREGLKSFLTKEESA